MMGKLIDNLDRLDLAESSQEVRDHRKHLLVEIQIHKEFLDESVRQAWTRMKLSDGTSNPNVPDHVDCSKYTPVSCIFY
jgi:hypothetical protein